MEFEIEREEIGPALSGVDSDLKKLRGHQGAGYEQMSKLKSLQALKVVSRERARQKRPIEDRGAIALDVIHCVAQNTTLMGRRDSRIVSWTLNLERRESMTLEARRQELCEEFGWEYLVYIPRERQAYEQLAGVLLRIEKSPCVEEDPRDMIWAKSAGQMRLTFDELAQNFLSLGFAALRATRNDEETLSAARKIFDALPLGREYANFVYSGTDSERLAKLLRDAVAAYFPAWSQVLGMRGHIDDSPDPYDFSRLFALMALHPGSSEWRLMRLWLPRRRWKDYEDNVRGPRSQDAIATGYEVVIRISMALEISDDWASLEHPTGHGRTAPVRDPITPAPVA